MAARLKVLIVDDQPAVVHALQVLFDLNDVSSVAAASPTEALEIVSQDSAGIGVVVQDMNFGRDQTSGEEGIQLFRRIRAIEPELPVLLMTAWASLETAVLLVKEGANDYLAKPWDDEKLLFTIKNLLKIRLLQLENARLQQRQTEDRRALAERHDLCGLAYVSDAMHRVVSLGLSVAGSDAPVLITGPSGVGKEKLAEIVQANSRRRDRPFLRVNVGALPEELMEAELFGAEAGAYTGATSLRVGRFEAANGGTLFLDEIDALSASGQVKLLRVIQSGEFQRLGSSKTRHADVRIVSASNADLRARVGDGRFREDLFYRINVIELAVPPLAEREADIPELAQLFLQEAAASQNQETPELTNEALEAMLHHRWDGNVRELQNRIQRAVLTGGGSPVTPAHLDLKPGTPRALPGGSEQNLSERELREKERIEQLLLNTDGVVAKAAQRLGLSRQALYRRMEKLGIVLERRPKTR